MHPSDSRELVRLRRHLHSLAEVSGTEEATAAFVAQELAACRPSDLHTGLGGHGVASVFAAADQAGPDVILRAELDALPIPESAHLAHASRNPDCSHRCGHDGHMAILLGVARGLAAAPPARGSVTLLFQPAEETGTGAEALVQDPRFTRLPCDWIFALHNLPGYPTGRVLLREGPFCAGSAGVRVGLAGRTSHAAYPEQGHSPDRAMAELVLELVNLADPLTREGHLALITVVHSRLGEPAFGITPGEAEILATVRSDEDAVLEELKNLAVTAASDTAARHGLACRTSFTEEFPVTINDPAAVAVIQAAADDLGLPTMAPTESPFRWSEDFGILAGRTRGALVGLGSGADHPVLHAADYDFNDALLDPGTRLLLAAVGTLCG